MAMYCLNLLRISLELAQHNKVYEDIATKFFEHFLSIAAAINGVSDGHGTMPEEGLALWDDVDEFYYDELCLPDGKKTPLKVRSMVGLVPLFAVETLEPELLKVPAQLHRAHGMVSVAPARSREPGFALAGNGGRTPSAFAPARPSHEMPAPPGARRIGILERLRHPRPFKNSRGQTVPPGMRRRAQNEVSYWPGESEGGLFGGNSNWRGPVWLPMNFLLIESLQKFHHYYGDEFKIECPVGSGKFLNLDEAAEEISARLTRLFLKDKTGQRPALKNYPKLAADPHFRNYVLFHEYFHGDTGHGLGAAHQTGWTGLVAKLIMPRAGTQHPLKPVVVTAEPKLGQSEIGLVAHGT
jgi:hypothetical protein